MMMVDHAPKCYDSVIIAATVALPDGAGGARDAEGSDW